MLYVVFLKHLWCCKWWSRRNCLSVWGWLSKVVGVGFCRLDRPYPHLDNFEFLRGIPEKLFLFEDNFIIHQRVMEFRLTLDTLPVIFALIGFVFGKFNAWCNYHISYTSCVMIFPINKLLSVMLCFFFRHSWSNSQWHECVVLFDTRLQWQTLIHLYSSWYRPSKTNIYEWSCIKKCTFCAFCSKLLNQKGWYANYHIIKNVHRCSSLIHQFFSSSQIIGYTF